MVPEFQLVGIEPVPLKVTVLVPCVLPKFAPVMVTGVPTDPDVGLRLKIAGLDPGLKITQLLESPATLTTTQPGVAPVGTGTTIVVVFQLDGEARVPLNVTVLIPCGKPNPVPVMVTGLPIAPDWGETEEMSGKVPTVKNIELLEMPPTVTVTNPDVTPAGTDATI